MLEGRDGKESQATSLTHRDAARHLFRCLERAATIQPASPPSVAVEREFQVVAMPTDPNAAVTVLMCSKQM